MTNNFYTRTLQATQREPIVGKNMVPNNAGGYVFKVSPETRLDRFLILGTESGSYYCTARNMTLDNTKAIKKIIRSSRIFSHHKGKEEGRDSFKCLAISFIFLFGSRTITCFLKTLHLRLRNRWKALIAQLSEPSSKLLAAI